MLIDKIRLHNFRAYYGTQEIELSNNPEKHITIISGENGFGKTSLLTSLVWVLYGKLMVDVDERYSKEIRESGGYHRYAAKLINRAALIEATVLKVELEKAKRNTKNILEHRVITDKESQLYCFSVSVTITNILIPHLSSSNLTITRVYNTKTESESLEILIDGKENELTKTIGQEIFINDFVLPKEIAKFFFFDAEKITALAEVKSFDEKLYFSKAYNEVLGIKKYTDLKGNLENLKLRISKKSASKADLSKLEALQLKLDQDTQVLDISKLELEQKQQELVTKKADLAEIRERLVRAGSSMTTEELNDYRKLRVNLSEDLAKNKQKLSELLEFAPFAMLASKMHAVYKQLINEGKQQHLGLINDVLKEKHLHLKQALSSLKDSNQEKIDEILSELFATEEGTNDVLLLSYSQEQVLQFNGVYNNLQNAYAKSLKSIISDAKRMQSMLNLTQKKLKDADLKSSDPIIQKLKARFQELSKMVDSLEDEIIKLKIDIGISERDVTSNKRLLSEQSKFIKIEKHDAQKAETADRLIEQLSSFITELKLRKKFSLEKNIKKELNILMHKQDFVDRIDVKIEGDLIDIELYDKHANKINKDGLSKGEQQLYATALLKALITESNIQFPVFIDSPLQKLDKKHAANIIKQFYPDVSGQVVLFPLLEKELSEQEYKMLLPKIGKAYLIQQEKDYQSFFSDIWPSDIFAQFNQTQESYVS